MRFGHDFHLHQVPEWADSYVPYSSLKQLYSQTVRKAESTKPDFSELYTALEQSIDSVADSYTRRHEMLRLNEAELSRHARISRVMSASELYSLSQSMKDLKASFNKLQWFFRVNHEALARIYAKVEKWHVPYDERQSHRSKLIKLVETRDELVSPLIGRLDSLVKDVCQARADAEASEMSKLSCLKASIDRFSPSSCLAEHSERLSLCLLNDQAPDLSEILDTVFKKNDLPGDFPFDGLLEHLAYLSISSSARGCCRTLLLEQMPMHDIKPNHLLLNQMIITSGQYRHLADPEDLIIRTSCECDDHYDISGGHLFHLVLQTFGNSIPKILSMKDNLDRIPLHYAALYGLSNISRQIVAESRTSKGGNCASQILAKDFQQYTPLHYAVINNHPSVVKRLLGALHSTDQANSQPTDEKLIFNLLSIAIRSKFDDIVELLAKCHADPLIVSAQGESALYLATRSGNASYVKILLENGAASSINTLEPVYGWTPLFIACVNGHQAIVRALLQAGAQEDILDHNGWAPKEHAALRGHLALAGELAPLDMRSPCDGPAATPIKKDSEIKQALDQKKAHAIVNLGVLQYGKNAKAVDFRCTGNDVINIKTGLSLEISVSEQQSEIYVVELPFLANMVNDPFVFTLSNPSTASISFKLSRQVPGHPTSRSVIGSATALLENLSAAFGENRESLVRERTIPIVERETLDVIGTLTYTILLAKPMASPVSSFVPGSSVKRNYVQLVGHRGLGQNTASRNYLQLGENTVESFFTAAAHGATHVEFDAQLTRDLIPIIFHDFSLSESGTDIPIHDLTLDQFMHASNIQSHRGAPVSILGIPNKQNTRPKHRSRSLSRGHERGTQAIRERMKYTVDFMNKGFKPNTRGDFIQDSFTTLDELLEKLPESIGFNVEVKYPRLHEAAEAGVAPTAIEINIFVDKILERIFGSETNSDRDIILSSFTPEVCILLAIKQRRYPVMFITNAGKPPMTDKEMRASSLQAAVRFAKRWDLAGIVFASEALIMCPRLIAYVQKSGLTCGSYGLLNNIPENAKIQAEAGIDTLMADRVGLIAKTLKKTIS